jgi:hypothetical protein
MEQIHEKLLGAVLANRLCSGSHPLLIRNQLRVGAKAA